MYTATEPTSAYKQLNNIDGPSSSMNGSSLLDTELEADRLNPNISVLQADAGPNHYEYPSHGAQEKEDDSCMSASNPSMPDLEAQAKLCEYLTNSRRYNPSNSSSQNSRCANSWCCSSRSNSSQCNNPVSNNLKSDSSWCNSSKINRSVSNGSSPVGSSDIEDSSSM